MAYSVRLLVRYGNCRESMNECSDQALKAFADYGSESYGAPVIYAGCLLLLGNGDNGVGQN